MSSDWPVFVLLWVGGLLIGLGAGSCGESNNEPCYVDCSGKGYIYMDMEHPDGAGTIPTVTLTCKSKSETPFAD